jgi:cell division septation protein DedD
MPRNEDGEFELILGNRQLLSVFFIVVILLGVFFTMGYIVGRNSSPIIADTRKPERTDAASRPAPAPSTAAETAATPPPVVERSKDTAAVPPPKAEESKAEPVKPEPPPKPTNQTASPVPTEPQSGQTYLQLVATQKPEAELYVDVLGKKGFHAIYTSIPEKPGTYRILVGPLKDSAAISQARTDLDKAGFPGIKAIVRKY